MKQTVAFVLALAVLVGVSLPAAAAPGTVLRVVVVQTDSPDAYVKEIERGRAILKRLGSSATIRVWQARFAGENAGSVVVSIESPNLVTFAKDEEKAAGDAEFQAWIKGLGKLRKVVSDSLYNELTP